MGKGDKKSRRGKIWIKSHGVTRPRKKAKPTVAKVKPEVKVKKEKPVQAELAFAEVEEVKVKKAPKAKKEEVAEPKAKKVEAAEPKAKKAPKAEAAEKTEVKEKAEPKAKKAAKKEKE